MICLFSPDSVDFGHNGQVVLQPVSCKVSAELNGSWSLQMEHPMDPLGRWSYILPDCILRVPSFNGEQLFRIQYTQKTMDTITATAAPVFLDAAKEVFLTDIRPTGKTGQQALDILMQGTRYSGKSDISKKATAYYEYISLIDALSDGRDNCFLCRWGGEMLFDNYTVTINQQVGTDRGVNVFYGKNLMAVDESVDYSTIVTRIYPKGYNGCEMSGHGFIDSPVTYPFRRCATITYADIALAEDVSEEDQDMTICATRAELDAALTARAQAEFSAGLDKPSVSLNIDLAMLYQTGNERLYQELSNISLGDAVHCKHKSIGIDSVERVTALVYDCLQKQVEQCTIGSQRYNFISEIASLRL